MNKETGSVPIERGGGKLEITRALEEAGFPVPRSEYLYFDDLDKLQLLTACFNSLPKPLIVRGSHPNDWDGYIDVLPSFSNINSGEELQRAINKIKTTTASEDLAIHAADWGQSYSPEVHVLVQEQSRSPLSGSMLRHPHTANIDINYVDRVKYNTSAWRPTFNLAREYAKDREMENLDFDGEVSDEEFTYAFDIYKQVEQSGLVDNDYVYQMEIGFNPFLIYQLRPFKKKEAAKDFDLPYGFEANHPMISSKLVFGITPEEGIDLDFVTEDPVDFWHGKKLPQDNPYGLVIGSRMRGSLHPSVTYNNLVSYVCPSYDNQYLEHGDYRLLKRAKYSLCAYDAYNVKKSGLWDYYPKDLKVFGQSKLISNGERAVIIPKQYL